MCMGETFLCRVRPRRLAELQFVWVDADDSFYVVVNVSRPVVRRRLNGIIGGSYFISFFKVTYLVGKYAPSYSSRSAASEGGPVLARRGPTMGKRGAAAN